MTNAVPCMPEDFELDCAFVIEPAGDGKFILTIHLANGKALELARGFSSVEDAKGAASAVKSASIDVTG